MDKTLWEHYNSQNTNILLDSYAYHKHDFQPEVQKIIWEILRSRGITEFDVADYRIANLPQIPLFTYCKNCRNELMLDEQELGSGEFICPTCKTRQEVIYENVWKQELDLDPDKDFLLVKRPKHLPPKTTFDISKIYDGATDLSSALHRDPSQSMDSQSNYHNMEEYNEQQQNTVVSEPSVKAPPVDEQLIDEPLIEWQREKTKGGFIGIIGFGLIVMLFFSVHFFLTSFNSFHFKLAYPALIDTFFLVILIYQYLKKKQSFPMFLTFYLLLTLVLVAIEYYNPQFELHFSYLTKSPSTFFLLAVARAVIIIPYLFRSERVLETFVN